MRYGFQTKTIKLIWNKAYQKKKCEWDSKITFWKDPKTFMKTNNSKSKLNIFDTSILRCADLPFDFAKTSLNNSLACPYFMQISVHNLIN